MAENENNIVPAASEPTAPASKKNRSHRSEKVGTVASDKMQKTVVVRVDRLVRHTKYRRYVRKTSKFMAHTNLVPLWATKCELLRHVLFPRANAGELLR